MTTRAEEERIRQEQGQQQFLRQMSDMFAQTRTDMDQKYIPRPELEARLEHMDSVVERVMAAVEKLTANVENLRESNPQIFANRAETKQDQAELRAETKQDQADLRTEIEKLKTALDAFKERGYDWRYSDAQGRMRGDIAQERGWRGAMQERSTQQVDRMWIGALALIGLVSPIVSVILTLVLRK